MKKIRIASASGFWGDWLEAPIRQIEGGKIDYLALDYLAELTMSIMAGVKKKNPELGYAEDFVDLIDRTAKQLVEKKIKVITNAGGVNPLACAKRVKEVLEKKGISLKIAVITGDDLLPSIDNLLSLKEEFKNLDTGEKVEVIKDKLQSVNAYLGAEPAVSALKNGAQIVISGRLADPSLALAPLCYEFDWQKNDWNKLALGTIAAHLVECGAQGSGGNCSYDWQSIPDLANIGYPIIEADGSDKLVITKHENTGGRIDLRSIKEQLVYEIANPKEYITPDVVADFTSVKLKEVGKDRVELSAASGKPATDCYKVSISYENGYKTEGTLVYSWPEAYEKSKAAGQILKKRIADLGLDFDEVFCESIGAGACHGALSEFDASDLPEVTFRIAVRGQKKADLERFTSEIVPLVLSGPPGATGYSKGRPKVQRVYSYWPALVSKKLLTPEIIYI